LIKKEKMKQILHITPHLGGGVGTVVLNWLKSELKMNWETQHKVASLEVNKNSMQEIQELGLKINDGLYFNQKLLMDWVQQSEIVLIHLWNHPTLFDILVNREFPPCRLIIWNHVSGLNPPYIISEKLVEIADRFIFTSPVSYESKEIIDLSDALREKLGVIWSSCGTEIFEGFERKSHNGFIVGLTGTVDYGKLHPDFIRMCSNINIPDVQFMVCSGDSQERLKEDAAKFNIADKFNFNGRVESVMPYLAIYDVFGYPLQPKHFGSCEQALGEAMLAGVVPVVMNNPAERYIIEQGKTGLLADSLEEYVQAIEYLYHNPDERRRMSANAIAAAKIKYSIKRKMMEWEKLFKEVRKIEKKPRVWKNRKYIDGSSIFIEALGKYGEVFRDYIRAKEAHDIEKMPENEEKIYEMFQSNAQWQSENKGGVRQYLRIFPDDYYLKEWNEILTGR
jgi:L-malate glycosyltransferase